MERAPVFVLDASVALKWYVYEPDRETALRVRRDYLEGSIDLTAPKLMLYEIANALRFHPGATAVDVRDAVCELMAMHVATQDLTDAMAGSTAELAYRMNVTFYEAVYLALAEVLGTKAITADKRLHRRVGGARGLLLLLEDYKSQYR